MRLSSPGEKTSPSRWPFCRQRMRVMLGVGMLFLMTPYWMPYVATLTVHSHFIPLFHERCAVGVLDRWVDRHFAVFMVNPCHCTTYGRADRPGNDAYCIGDEIDVKGREWVVPGKALRPSSGQLPTEGDWGYLVAWRARPLWLLFGRFPATDYVLFVKDEAKSGRQTEKVRQRLHRLRRERRHR